MSTQGSHIARRLSLRPLGPLLGLASGLLVAGTGSGARAAQPVADRVYGQSTMTETVPNNPRLPTAAQFIKARGVGVNSLGVYICDEYNSRILFFPNGATVASQVIGQPDFDTMYQNAHGISADSLAMPKNMDASEGGVVIGDYRNCRALYYPLGSTRATVVYGQPSFSSTVPNFADPAREIKYPDGATVDNEGNVYVADTMDARVTYYPKGTNIATRIYSGTGTGVVSYFADPESAAVDSHGLYVADTYNNRVVFFPKDSLIATRVYGQPSFDSSVPNAGGVGPNTLYHPSDVAVDEDGVYIADTGNNRVLFYPGESTTATVVYGQPDFVSSGYYGPSATSVSVPGSVAVDRYGVYIAEIYGARVLRFPKAHVNRPNNLAFDVAPAGAPAYAPLGTAPVVRVIRRDGTLADDYNGPVTVHLVPADGASCARLLGTATVNAVAGKAAFTDLRVDAPGAYRLEATLSTLTPALSDAFTIGPAAPAIPGDFDRNGVVNLADTELAIKALAGLESLPAN